MDAILQAELTRQRLDLGPVRPIAPDLETQAGDPFFEETHRAHHEIEPVVRLDRPVADERERLAVRHRARDALRPESLLVE